jgi:hypothetical protein
VTALRLPLLERSVPPAVLRWEAALVCLVAWGLMLLVPLSMGSLALGWDALNHHIYLGWTAEQHRFDRDFLGSGYQAFQAPYLNWPVYRMAVGGWSGSAAALVLASLHVVAVAPVWMLARACIPGPAFFDAAMRALAVTLAFLSALVQSALASTMNDVLGAAPLVWAVALAIEPIARGDQFAPATTRRFVLLSGVAAGLAVALKLSNGPLAVLLPILWLLCARAWTGRLAAVVLGCAGGLAGFLAGYGYWGWLLWRFYGNPLYPFQDHWFAPLRAWTGWVG